MLSTNSGICAQHEITLLDVGTGIIKINDKITFFWSVARSSLKIINNRHVYHLTHIIIIILLFHSHLPPSTTTMAAPPNTMAMAVDIAPPPLPLTDYGTLRHGSTEIIITLLF